MTEQPDHLTPEPSPDSPDRRPTPLSPRRYALAQWVLFALGIGLLIVAFTTDLPLDLLIALGLLLSLHRWLLDERNPTRDQPPSPEMWY